MKTIQKMKLGIWVKLPLAHPIHLTIYRPLMVQLRYLELEQDGYGTEIYYNELIRNDFPLSVNVDSESDSIGAVKMYVDGEVFRLNPNDNPYVWIVEFEAVEE